MRIALDATPLLGRRTGIGAFTLAALTALAAHPELRLSAYALTWRGRGKLPGELPDGVRAVERPMAARPLRVLWSRFDGPAIERWTGPLEVVHGTNFVVPPSRCAGVVTVHDLTVLRFPELCDKATLAYPSLLRRALRRGAWVHAVSEFVAAEVIEHLGAPPERVVAVLSGVPVVAAGSPGEGRRLAGADTYVLALGAVEPRKDHTTLVAAFDRLARRRPDVRLVIAGPEAWGRGQLDSALAAARHSERVVRLGYVSDSQRADLLSGAAALAFPSRYEGFGFPALEAMAAGVPVVATDAGAIGEVTAGAALLVAVGDADGLAEALELVLDDDGERARLVELGRRRAGELSWERCAAGLVDLYGRAAASA